MEIGEDGLHFAGVETFVEAAQEGFIAAHR
jgi:hypothetical protein